MLLGAGTPVSVILGQEISSATSKTGDIFPVTVLHDVIRAGRIVIPQGTAGQGEVIFAGGTGGFGRAGILLISLRSLDLGEGRTVALEGRFRQEGKDNSGITYATWAAVGIFSGFVKGKTGTINKGRQLDGRTAEDITLNIADTGPAPPPATTATAPESGLPPAGHAENSAASSPEGSGTLHQ